MSDNDLIESLQRKIAELEAQIAPFKHSVNALCKASGRPEIYNMADTEGMGLSKPEPSLRVDHFYNRPLATCVSEYLEMLKDAGADGPATIDEIYDALTRGGFKFEGATGSDENNKRALKIAMTKNTAMFSKIGERFGLKKWYGGKRAARKPSGSQASSDKSSQEENEENATDDSEESQEQDESTGSEDTPPNDIPDPLA